MCATRPNQRPPISTRRVDRSMKNRTMNRSKPFEVRTSIMKKSDAAMSCQKFSPGWLNAVLENLDRFVRQHVPNSRVLWYPAVAPARFCSAI